MDDTAPTQVGGALTLDTTLLSQGTLGSLAITTRLGPPSILRKSNQLRIIHRNQENGQRYHTMSKQTKPNEADSNNPEHGLNAVLAGFEPKIRDLFGIALTIYAGPNASSMTDAEKLAQLKSKIEE